MKVEYENLIPEIPYIGGIRNYLSATIVNGMSNFAMFRVLEEEGFSLRDIGKFCDELGSIYLDVRKKELSEDFKRY